MQFRLSRTAGKTVSKLALGSVLLSALLACMPNSIKEERAFIDSTLTNSPLVEHQKIEYSGGVMHSATIARQGARDNELAAVVFVHGTPGSWQHWAYFLMHEQLQTEAMLVSIDRAGWGASTVDDQSQAIDFSYQSRAISAVLRNLQNNHNVQRIVLVGHSLGASIVPRVAMDYPELVDAVLILAGSLDPQLGGPRWFNRLAAVPGVYWLLPHALEFSNREIMGLQDNLVAMNSHWGELTQPVRIVQGMQDKLVYPGNIDFLERTLSAGQLHATRLEAAGHLLHLEQRPLLLSELRALITP
ncbi:MAG: alpha/beta fold hydrolase [Pseudomonadota bacterium]